MHATGFGTSASGARFFLLLMALAASLHPEQAKADAFPDTIYFDGFEACGLQCARVQCPGNGTTSLSGTIYAPEGTLPLPNVEVYIANATVAPLVDGPPALRCDQAPSGHPLVATLTDSDGKFKLVNVPAGTPMNLVVLAGKWRRQAAVPALSACIDTPIDPVATRLPRTHVEGDIPLTAVVTGNGEALECLLRKTGVADSEFGSNSGSARIRLFTGNGASSIDGGGALANATTLWATGTSLSSYDQVMLACESAQQPATQPQTAVDGMKTYADSGGRVYLSHWQNLWIAGQINGGIIGAWPTVASWNFNASTVSGSKTATINATFVQGKTLEDWLFATGASAIVGSLVLNEPRQTTTAVDGSAARSWMTLNTVENGTSIPYFSFTTPTTAADGAQQGRVLFVDLHANAGGADMSATGSSFPSSGCHSAVNTMTAQEKALLYATFDLQRCVGSTRE